MNDKKNFTVFLLFLMLFVTGAAFVQEDVAKAAKCKYCGMDRTRQAQHRMFILYEDGSETGTCSVRCLAIDMIVNGAKIPVSIQAADYRSRYLIDAETAFWVIGGNIPEGMSKQAKWAFSRKEYADKFIREHGGTAATFEEVMRAAYENMYEDIVHARQERRAMLNREKSKSLGK